MDEGTQGESPTGKGGELNGQATDQGPREGVESPGLDVDAGVILLACVLGLIAAVGAIVLVVTLWG